MGSCSSSRSKLPILTFQISDNFLSQISDNFLSHLKVINYIQVSVMHNGSHIL